MRHLARAHGHPAASRRHGHGVVVGRGRRDLGLEIEVVAGRRQIAFLALGHRAHEHAGAPHLVRDGQAASLLGGRELVDLRDLAVGDHAVAPGPLGQE